MPKRISRSKRIRVNRSKRIIISRIKRIIISRSKRISRRKFRSFRSFSTRIRPIIGLGRQVLRHKSNSPHSIPKELSKKLALLLTEAGKSKVQDEIKSMLKKL
jgi:hypothetical protein